MLDDGTSPFGDGEWVESGEGPEAIHEILEIFARFASSGARDIPDGDAHAIPDASLPVDAETPTLLRYLGDDIKAYDFEAAASQPGRAFPSPDQLNDCFFLRTLAGEVFYQVRQRFLETEDQSLPINDRPSFIIVPTAMQDRRPERVRTERAGHRLRRDGRVHATAAELETLDRLVIDRIVCVSDTVDLPDRAGALMKDGGSP